MKCRPKSIALNLLLARYNLFKKPEDKKGQKIYDNTSKSDGITPVLPDNEVLHVFKGYRI